MLFNLSNHPANVEKSTWSSEQKAAAAEMFGEGIIDLGFPACTPDMSDEQLRGIAHEVARDIAGAAKAQLGVSNLRDGKYPVGAMVAGHYILATYLVCALQAEGIPCYVGDSVRVAEELEQNDGTIAVVHRFQFAGFRKYPAIMLEDDARFVATTGAW